MVKFLNWAGWAWTIYDLADWGYDWFSAESRATIYQAGLIAGENFLIPVFLEYQGKPYVAGFEGIIGTPRGFSTILYGQLTGDGANQDRALLLLDMLTHMSEDTQ